MVWNVYLTKLQSVLAQVFPLQDICIVLCHEAGVDTSRIDFNEPSWVRWFHILDEALKQETVDKLLAVAVGKYPQNRSLKQAMADLVAGGSAELVSADYVFQASVVRDLAAMDARLLATEAALLALAAGREAEIAAGSVGGREGQIPGQGAV